MLRGIIIYKKIGIRTSLIKVFAEVLGTAVLMFLGCMGGVSGFGGKEAPSVQGAVVFGATVASIIQMLGHISGAHLNPAVTISAWLWGSISLPLSIAYIIGQIGGALLGFSALTSLTPDELMNFGRAANATGGFCTTTPAAEITTVQAFFGEFLSTGLLILLCCGCWDVRCSKNQDSVAIKFGILVAAISAAQGPYTGASMNPARTLAPSVVLNKWDQHWIYWVAPLAAAIFFTLLYKALLVHSFEEEILPSNTQNTPLSLIKSREEEKSSGI